MRSGSIRPSKKTVFFGLMGLSLVSLRLPPDVADQAKHGTQLLVWLQDAVYRSCHWAGRSVDQIAGEQLPPSASEWALAHQLVAQAGLIEELRGEIQNLTSMKAQGIPLALHAHIVARDVALWRDSLLLERGSELGVHRKDWVASRLFINLGDLAGVREGQAVLAREVLLGRVEGVSPYMARVQLFSDVDSAPVEVRVGGLCEGAFEPVDYPCSLRGLGRGQMVIEHVDYRQVQAESAAQEGEAPGGRRIQLGDYVYSAPAQFGLPHPMVIGRVSSIEADPKRRLVYDVRVEPAVEIDRLRDVHVIPLIPPRLAME